MLPPDPRWEELQLFDKWVDDPVAYEAYLDQLAAALGTEPEPATVCTSAQLRLFSDGESVCRRDSADQGQNPGPPASSAGGPP